MKGNNLYVLFIIVAIFLAISFSGGFSFFGDDEDSTGSSGSLPGNETKGISYRLSPCPNDDITESTSIRQTVTVDLKNDTAGYAEIQVLLNGGYTTAFTKTFTPPTLEFQIPFSQATGVGHFPWKILFYKGAPGSGSLQDSKALDVSDCF